MASPIIKGEYHSSRADLEDEREMLAEGIDALILEGSEERGGYGRLHGWFGIAMLIFEYLFARFLYADHTILEDIARGQGAEVIRTRKTDADILHNSHAIVVAIAFATFYGLICASVVWGLLFSETTGAALLVGAGVIPLLILRIHESWKDDGNRDQKIAEQIIEANQKYDRVVVVVGQKHAEHIPDYLPDDMEYELKEPKHDTFSVPMMRDLAYPSLQLVATLGLVYPAFLFVAKLFLVTMG
jgi:hypothetical protein